MRVYLHGREVLHASDPRVNSSSEIRLLDEYGGVFVLRGKVSDSHSLLLDPL
jgi:hypothetical protein